MTTTVTMIDPRGKSFEYWSALMSEQLAGIGITYPGTTDHWKDWARRFVSQVAVLSQGIPLPENYPSWQKWAENLLNYTVTF